MFKKKNELPPRPKPPTNEQILEDLEVALPDDPVFSEGSSNDVEEELSVLNENFLTIKRFMEANQSLQLLMAGLEDKNTNLQKSNLELQDIAKDIRQQALNALK